MDRFKKDNSELGANARQVARLLDRLREQGDLTKGLLLESGGYLRIEMNHRNVKLPESWIDGKNDNRILKVCRGIQKEESLKDADVASEVILVTKDIFERIKADVIGITAQDFFNERVPNYDEQYKGVAEVWTTGEGLNRFYQERGLPLSAVFQAEDVEHQPRLTTNEFLILHSSDNPQQTALGRFDGKAIVPLWYDEERPFGVKPRNVRQKFFQEALMMDARTAPLVIVKGPAGTAKTFYSLAVGLHKMFQVESQGYRKILVCRPSVKMDEDIGFLPGTEEEKIAPFLRPVIDNLEILVDSNEAERYQSEMELKDKIDELFDRKIITTEAIAFIRGRSIAKQWVIIDEAQNLTPRQVKGIITRAGAGTKIILVGDPEQIDHPFLDERTNGLCYAAERMKGSPLCYQLTLSEDDCERSPLASESSVRMR
jgi:PhoH-like ATPase